MKPLWKPVHSTLVTKVAHFEDKLYVVFKRNGSVYEYTPVDDKLYKKLISSNSFGREFHMRVVKNKKINYKRSDVEV
jgi:hypothetical protein